MLGFAGVTIIVRIDALPTFNAVLPEIDPRVALIVIEPITKAVANPPALMEAAGAVVQRYIPQFADHVTCVVIFLLVPSE